MRFYLAVTCPTPPGDGTILGDRLPLVIGGEATAAVLPEFTTPHGEIISRNGQFFLHLYQDGVPPLPLADGDTFALGKCQFRLVLTRDLPKQNRRARLQEKIFGITVALLILLQLFTVTVLPDILKKSTLWDNQCARMLLNRKINELTGTIRDNLRRDDHPATTPAATQPDFVAQALLRQLNQEVMSMARYLRQYSDQMTRTQRRRMLADIEKIRQTVETLLKASPLPPLPTLQLDQCVENIIKQHLHE